MDYRNGVSCLIVNTEQGKKLIEKYKDDLKLIESDFEKAAEENRQLNRASVCNVEKRDEILNLYSKNGYESVENSFRKIGFLNIVKNLVPVRMKNYVRKILIRME